MIPVLKWLSLPPGGYGQSPAGNENVDHVASLSLYYLSASFQLKNSDFGIHPLTLLVIHALDWIVLLSGGNNRSNLCLNSRIFSPLPHKNAWNILFLNWKKNEGTWSCPPVSRLCHCYSSLPIDASIAARDFEIFEYLDVSHVFLDTHFIAIWSGIYELSSDKISGSGLNPLPASSLRSDQFHTDCVFSEWAGSHSDLFVLWMCFLNCGVVGKLLQAMLSLVVGRNGATGYTECLKFQADGLFSLKPCVVSFDWESTNYLKTDSK